VVFLAILAARTPTVLCTCHSKLVTLAVVFDTAGLLTIAAFNMLSSVKFLFESLWVSLYYFSDSYMSFVLIIISIVAVCTSALFTTYPAVSEAFTIKL